MRSSASARRARCRHSSRVVACTMSLASMESKWSETIEPVCTPVSKRMPGPLGALSAVIRPGNGANPSDGSSALRRNSIACPSCAGLSAAIDAPAAIRSCQATRSMPLVISVTGCSTWIRVLTSMNESVPSGATRNSTVPAPTYPTSEQIATAASSSRCVMLPGRKGAGASSISFWLRRWSEQSLVPTAMTPPYVSPST